MNDTNLFYISTILISILGVTIGAIAYSYRQLIKKYYLLKEEQDRLVKSSETEAAEIISKAKLQAEKLLHQADDLGIKLQSDLSSELEKAKAQQAQNYQVILDSLKNESSTVMQTISKEIQAQLAQEVEKFVSSIQGEVVKSNQLVIESIKMEFQKVQKDLDTYKKDMQSRVDDNIYSILMEVSNKVIGEAINLEEHENLVIKALDDARKQNMF